MNNKFDLSDLSIIIPFRMDTEDRLNNLNNIIRYFDLFFVNHELIIIENSDQSFFVNTSSNTKYIFEKSTKLLHRTRMLNDGAKLSTRKYVALYDTDVVFYPYFLNDCMDNMRINSVVFSFPYNGIFMCISGQDKINFLRDFSFEKVPLIESGAVPGNKYTKEYTISCDHPTSVGGATIFQKDIFLQYGGYNKKFIAWGFEDNELVARFSKLGYSPSRSKGNLIHLDHRRGLDSAPGHPFYTNNQQEYQKIVSMNKEQLLHYINTELL